MKSVTTTAFALLLATTAGPALAATTTNAVPPPTSSSTKMDSPEATNMRQQIQNDLAKAGFSDIRIMPESFMVRAKDSHGNPVMMIINPDSLTEVTTMAPPKNSAANNSAATNASPSNGSAATPAPAKP
jgi:hypothetical protein